MTHPALTIPAGYHRDAQLHRIRDEALRLAREASHLTHRVITATPYGTHPDTEATLNRIANVNAYAHAVFRNLTAELEQRHD